MEAPSLLIVKRGKWGADLMIRKSAENIATIIDERGIESFKEILAPNT